VQRSLTLIAKVIQSLANLNAVSEVLALLPPSPSRLIVNLVQTVQKEEFMRGVKDFLRDSLPAMIDYILVVSTPPTSDPHGHYAGSADNRHDRLNIVNSLRQRTAIMPVLDREAIPILPHLLDIPRHLAVISSAIIRSSRSYLVKQDGDPRLHDLCNKCFEIEEHALHQVSQLASRISSERRWPPAQGTPDEFCPYSTTYTISGPGQSLQIGSERRNPQQRSRPSTARSSDTDVSGHRQLFSDGSIPSSPMSYLGPSPRLLTQGSQTEVSAGQPSSTPEGRDWSHTGHGLLHLKSTSTDGIGLAARAVVDAPFEPSAVDPPGEAGEDETKTKKGLLRGILTRR